MENENKVIEAEHQERDISMLANKLKNKNTIILILIGIVVIAFLGQHLILSHKAKKIEEEYSEMMAENKEEIIVSDEIKVDKSTLIKVVTNARELVTREYTYTNADVYTKDKKLFKTKISVPFTTDKTVFTYKGTMKVGVDLSSFGEDTLTVDESNKVIQVKLSQPKILSHEIDNNGFKSYDVKNSVFTSTSLDDYADLVDVLMEKEETELNKDDDFWEDTRTETEKALSELLNATGTIDDYQINYIWGE